MSGEFGDYRGGYFHDKIQNAADDCLGEVNAHPVTHAAGEFLEAFYQIARDISLYQTSDSSRLRQNARQHLPACRSAWAELERVLAQAHEKC